VSEPAALTLVDADRFDRLRRISWWNQDKLRSAKVAVIGAGALGNEILKNLALLGVGNIFVADLDRIEMSNLSRSILFRERDNGRPKAEVAAEAVRGVYPDVNVHWFHGDVIYDLGLGVYRWADVAIAGLDNREARLSINRYCWKTNTPWIDGATEVLQGVVRVFIPPDGACYECTMSAADWEVLNERRGCGGLRNDGAPPVRIPTTPITASIIAGLQCQEAVKLLHGLDGLSGQGLVFNGNMNESYTVRYSFNQECNSHETFDRIVPLERSVTDTSLRELLSMAQSDLGPGAAIEFNQDILTAFSCPRCNTSEPVFRPRGSVPESAAVCPACRELRQPVVSTSFSDGDAFADKTLADFGVPRFDIVGARKGLTRIGYEFSSDSDAILGPLRSPDSRLPTPGQPAPDSLPS
jgi:molybdopterin/thiamine biosynthesis adenylyltransferase